MTRFVLCLVTLVLLTPTYAPAEVAPARTAVIGDGADAITVVYLDQPTAYERGFAYGKALASQMAVMVPRFLQSFEWTPERMDEVYAMQEPFISDDIKEEMRGLADGSGLPLEAIHRAHIVPELAEFHCSNFAAWGSATEDGRLYAIRVLDWEMNSGCQDYPVIVVSRPESGNLWVGVNWAGFVGAVSGFNEKGISVGEMTAGTTFPERLEGEPMPFVFREVLRYSSTLGEAVENFRNATRTSCFFFAVGDAKIPAGEILLTGYDQFLEINGGDPKYALFGLPAIQDVVYGSYKNQLCAQMLQENHGAINVDIAKRIARAVASDDSALHMVVFDPGNLKIWVANAEGKEPSQKRPFVEFDLQQFLEAVK